MMRLSPLLGWRGEREGGILLLTSSPGRNKSLFSFQDVNKAGKVEEG